MRFEAGLPSKLSELPLALEMQSAVTPLEVSGIQSLKCLIIASQCVCACDQMSAVEENLVALATTKHHRHRHQHHLQCLG